MKLKKYVSTIISNNILVPYNVFSIAYSQTLRLTEAKKDDIQNKPHSEQLQHSADSLQY